MASKNPYEWATKDVDLPAEDERKEVNERLHRLFKANPEGLAILTDWLRAYVFAPRLNMDPSMYELGLRDGQAHLARVITLAINEVENV